MTPHTRRALLLWACLLAFLLAGVIGVGTASAAALAPHSGGCGETQWWNTAYGISYDADTAAPALNSTYGEAFSLSGQWAPDISAALMTCGTSKVALLYFGLGDAAGFYVSTTVDNQTSYAYYPSSATWDPIAANHRSLQLVLNPHKSYTFQVAACYAYACSNWSPHLTLVTYTNISCLSGYVWRAANPYDQVCVTPAERSQVAYDNSQAPYRINPNGAYGPYTCVNGYVWRAAFGGDYTCVTPAERSQAASDNSWAAYRIVAL